ncbi:hypothetical protein K3495_g6747 [Podosphaera aphanis]|nr:hypothetical protein K3495_g6747 [Podosphaera aphanis]
MRDNFARKGESRVTQITSRQYATQFKGTASTSTLSPVSQTPGPRLVDHEGDVAMGGMKIDLHTLANIVAQVNSLSAGN